MLTCLCNEYCKNFIKEFYIIQTLSGIWQYTVKENGPPKWKIKRLLYY